VTVTARQPQRDRPKILVLITEDWFALSHFKPLISLLAEIGDPVVATRSSGRDDEIEALGARMIRFDLKRASLNPLQQALTIRRLAELITAEKPDVVHVIAMQPMVLAGLATRFAKVPHVVLHLTGLGFLAISEGRAARVIRPAAFRVLSRVLADPSSHLFAENPDDVAYMADHGACAGGRVTILGGAGLDLTGFPVLPQPQRTPPIAALVGRMIRSKGIETLIEAKKMLRGRGVSIEIALYGRSDSDNPEAIPPERLRAWEAEGLITWHGHVEDLASVWREAAIAVLPAITREGMPRAVLEAAAYARPQIVTDVPGCRHFVRHGVDGLVVPPGNAIALADGLQKLAADPELQASLGTAARARVETGFTIQHVQDGLRAGYAQLLRSGRLSSASG